MMTGHCMNAQFLGRVYNGQEFLNLLGHSVQYPRIVESIILYILPQLVRTLQLTVFYLICYGMYSPYHFYRLLSLLKSL